MVHHDDSRDDGALVALVLAGEREAFAPLLLRYYPSVLRLCERLVGPTLEAQDIAQEAALQAFLGLNRLQEPARFGAWLHAIAANLARMALRRRRPLSLDGLADGAPMVVLWSAGVHTPEDAHAARETHDAIVAALNELSVVNREVVIGFYLEGYSYAELAELLGVPVSTIKGRLFKGRRQLQRALESVAQEVLKPDRRPRKERTMEPSDLVEVQIDSVRLSLITQHRIVVLREKGGERILPIWIGPFEADAIRLALEGHQPARPMTHDLTLRLLEPLGAQVQQVVVSKVAEHTFYAEITLALGDQLHVIDARPSDALALAVRTGVPTFVARAVFEQASSTKLEEEITEGDRFLSGVTQGQAAERSWALSLELQPNTSASIVIEQLGGLGWPDTFPVRQVEWEGQARQAVQLPSPNGPAWLLVDAITWERIIEMTRRTQPVVTLHHPGAPAQEATGSAPRPEAAPEA